MKARSGSLVPPTPTVVDRFRELLKLSGDSEYNMLATCPSDRVALSALASPAEKPNFVRLLLLGPWL